MHKLKQPYLSTILSEHIDTIKSIEKAILDDGTYHARSLCANNLFYSTFAPHAASFDPISKIIPQTDACLYTGYRHGHKVEVAATSNTSGDGDIATVVDSNGEIMGVGVKNLYALPPNEYDFVMLAIYTKAFTITEIQTFPGDDRLLVHATALDARFAFHFSLDKVPEVMDNYIISEDMTTNGSAFSNAIIAAWRESGDFVEPDTVVSESQAKQLVEILKTIQFEQ